ncbi:MAG: hypothetical protein ACREMQ_13775 [Longimicrobiales bacterium]
MPHLEAGGPVAGTGYLEIDAGLGRSVALPLLVAGTLLTVQTRNTLYHFVVEDGSRLSVSVTGGRLFQQRTSAALLGAIDDDGHAKVGWIVEGRRLELHTDQGPVITSVVESVAVDGDATSLSGEEMVDN